MVNVVSEDVLSLLRKWATALDPKPASVLALGSLIYREGSQFGSSSDVDLIIELPELKDGLARARWMQSFLPQKIALEDALGKLLRRAREEFICSVVVVSKLDIACNVHKDGASQFYSANRFHDLLTGQDRMGLEGAGSRRIDQRLVMECFRFAQKYRNEFLKANALGDRAMKEHVGTDAAPKPIMRHAAMVQNLQNGADGDPGAEYDLDIGADWLTVLMHGRRTSLPELGHRLRTRRNARSGPEPLTEFDQLALAELILDAAVAHWFATLEKAKSQRPYLNALHSTVHFSQRFANAFPGVRGIKWFVQPEDIGRRLDRLLLAPLLINEASPVWWTRGNTNLEIVSFESGQPISLLNESELKITRIAACSGPSYKYNFVYLEAAGIEAVGLYESTPATVAEVEKGDYYSSYYAEEYGIVDNKHLVTRAEYDDGSADIEGELQSISGRTVHRVRYVTPYNLIIAAGGSPLLDQSYDMVLEEHLDAMLRGEDRLQAIAEQISRIPAGRY